MQLVKGVTNAMLNSSVHAFNCLTTKLKYQNKYPRVSTWEVYYY